MVNLKKMNKESVGWYSHKVAFLSKMDIYEIFEYIWGLIFLYMLSLLLEK